ncbi:glutathione S-transferase family protein [Roseobacter sp. HKCCA0434]|uniref:glutathione S-transferase family protein n=1 Tax=Roseobacter sp. HKCCA0434 TaxID=3079297 RepID=UPI002905A68C|nr:glutathione S-transferase family protein [Roseobacter sp. HKCCA0434]
MPTLYHSPMTRSTAIVALIEEMGIADRIDVIDVTIPRQDGTGAPDPRNPHPEGKVPYLVHGEDGIRERGAIIIYLTDLFPDSGLGRPVGHLQRGTFLGWLFYYQGVIEPVLVLDFTGLDHPALTATFRDRGAVMARLEEALADGPYLLGAEYSAVDLLISGAFHWFPDLLTGHPAVKAWADRCADRPALKAVTARDAAALAG